MKLAIDGAEQWELLQAAQYLFSHPPRSAGGRQQLNTGGSLQAERLRNYKDFFDIDIQMMLLYVHPDWELSDAAFKQCCDAFNSLLATFEDLLDDSILGSDESKPSSSAITVSNTHKKRGLKRLFARPYHSRTDAEPQPSNRHFTKKQPSLPVPCLPVLPFPKLQILRKNLHVEGGHVQHLQGIKTIIRQPEVEDYITILQEINSFGRTMRQLYGTVIDPYDVSADPKLANAESESKPDDGAHSVKRKLLHVLHSSLIRCVTSCNCSHEARLYFPISQASDTEFEVDMFLSTCQEPFEWQEARCLVRSMDQSGQRYTKVQNLCNAINRSQSCRNLLRLLAIDERLWDCSRLWERRLNAGSSPIVSLQSLLNNGHFSSQSRKDFSRVSLKERRILAVILAHTLLCLCDSPWIQEPWNAAMIFFQYDPSTQRLPNIRQPYTAGSLKFNLQEVEPHADRIHKHPLILGFAQLLLELNYGETIQATREDYDAHTQKETPDTPFFMISRVLREASEDMYGDYLAAIQACLDFGSLPPTQTPSLNHAEFRALFYDNVVAPLEKELFKGFEIKVHELESTNLREPQIALKKTKTSHQLRPTITHLDDCQVGQLPLSIVEYPSIDYAVSSTIIPKSSQNSLSTLPPQISPRDVYKYAVICPMAVEMTPVLAILDESYAEVPSPRGRNAYTLGRIGHHKVVVTVMPDTGTNSAAMVATQLRNDFPFLRFGLLVGVGGGIPNPPTYDIRLGDVVVSKPTNTFGGVVQFDRGKISTDRDFERTGSLNKPPAIVMATLETLIAQHKLNGDTLSNHLSGMLERHPNLRDGQYTHQGEGNDILFLSTHPHHADGDCQSCGKEMVVKRQPRESTAPRIHYGTIGSSNIVVKDAVTRDKLQRELGIICLEMEAAGLIDVLPCLVIRGICDYADSHKLKTWQPYAAATAAAFAKEFLSILR
ncbi:hypothetical protein BDV12DRAFT_178605 [Aspergillus spectabilis]